MVISQHTFAFLEKMPHDLREEFKNELTRKFAEIRFKNYRDRHGDWCKQKDLKDTDIPVYYSALMIYAEKGVS